MEQEPKTPRERAKDLIRLLIPDWRPTPKRILWTVRVVLALVALYVLIQLGYALQWTGFGQTEVQGGVQPAKTLWDWMELLIIPIVLAIGGYLFTRSENRAARFVAQQRAQDEALQAYLDQMSQMLTDRDRPLRRAQPGDDLSTVARAQTLTVLLKLDGAHKGSLLRFLYESGLLNKDAPVFELSGADLGRADVSRAALGDATLPPPLFGPPSPVGGTFGLLNLSGANLSGANLNEVNLSSTILREANLTRAHLNDATLDRSSLDGADLRDANLNYAKLRASSLRGVSLIGAFLSLANLQGSMLNEANLYTADLTGADLTGTDLSGANLTYAILHQATLTGTTLSGADLRGVILQGMQDPPIDDAALQAQFGRANLKGATMPDGQVLKGPQSPNGPTFKEWRQSRQRQG